MAHTKGIEMHQSAFSMADEKGIKTDQSASTAIRPGYINWAQERPLHIWDVKAAWRHPRGWRTAWTWAACWDRLRVLLGAIFCMLQS